MVFVFDGNIVELWVFIGLVIVWVFGKVNFYLVVGDCCEDGYYELIMVFYVVLLVDEVIVCNVDVFLFELVGEGVD